MGKLICICIQYVISIYKDVPFFLCLYIHYFMWLGSLSRNISSSVGGDLEHTTTKNWHSTFIAIAVLTCPQLK